MCHTGLTWRAVPRDKWKETQMNEFLKKEYSLRTFVFQSPVFGAVPVSWYSSLVSFAAKYMDSATANVLAKVNAVWKSCAERRRVGTIGKGLQSVSWIRQPVEQVHRAIGGAVSQTTRSNNRNARATGRVCDTCGVDCFRREWEMLRLPGPQSKWAMREVRRTLIRHHRRPHHTRGVTHNTSPTLSVKQVNQWNARNFLPRFGQIHQTTGVAMKIVARYY